MTSEFNLGGKRVWVAGHRGMVGSALVRRLQSEDCDIETVTRDVVDLRDGGRVLEWMQDVRPEAVFIPAAKVGGIFANDNYPAEFLYDNLMIASNIIHASYQVGVEKLLFLGSSCIYPRLAPQPIPEDALLTGPLEPTNEWYAIAKIAGIKLCEAYRKQYGVDYISAMPTNLYGPGDNFDPMNSHVIPGLIRRVHESKMADDKSVTLWGTGKPLREFMHADDCADALVYLMKNYSGDQHVNCGSGQECSIRELMDMIIDVVGFEGKIEHDLTKKDGTPRKLMDSSTLLEMGWKPQIALRDGLAEAYEFFKDYVVKTPA